MALNRPVAVIGSATRLPIAGDQYSLEEVLYQVSQAALADAGLTIADVDGIVVGSNDQVDGRAISVMMASGSVGGVDRDILSTPSAGEHAFVMGMLRVASAQFETQLVVAWGVTESNSLSEVERLANDPYFHRRLPQDDLSTYALQANQLLAATPTARDLAARLTEANLKRGAQAYPQVAAPVQTAAAIAASEAVRWPLRAGMCSTPVAGAVAIVLGSADLVKKKGITKAAYIRGAGWATDAAFMGDRDLTATPALDAALGQALRDAGAKDLAGVEVAEVSGPTPYQELLAYRGLGLGDAPQWPALIDGTAGPKINPSGGMMALNAVFCGGLARIAEAAAQVRGVAGAHQVAGCQRAVAHAASGPAMMYQAVVLLDRNP